MESGTALHLALLRKTSNARTRNKSHRNNFTKFKLQPLPQQNFELSGWSIEENQFKEEKKCKKIRNQVLKNNNITKERPMFADITNNKRTIKTSQIKYRRQNYSVSQATYRNNSNCVDNFQLYRQLDVLATETQQNNGKNKNDELPVEFLNSHPNENYELDNLVNWKKQINLLKKQKYSKFSIGNLQERKKDCKKQAVAKLNIYYTGRPLSSDKKLIVLKKNNNQCNQENTKKLFIPQKKCNSNLLNNNKQSFSKFLYFKSKSDKNRKQRL